MRVFKIIEARHNGKQIEVTKYGKHTRGVEIEVRHNLPIVTGKSFRWVQTVSDSGTFGQRCGNPHVDPFGFGDPSIHKFALPGTVGACKADDLKPFYWTDAEFIGGAGPNFSDRPSEPVPAKGRTWTQFVLALTEVTGKNVHHLVTIRWGYDRMADGSIRVAAIRRPTSEEMRKHGQTLKRMYPTYHYT
jgi:hypothetical protein